MQIAQVPTTVEDREEECLQHSTEVIRRDISRREQKIVSTLNGEQWRPRQPGEPGEYDFFLRCPRVDTCDGKFLINIYVSCYQKKRFITCIVVLLVLIFSNVR